MKRTLSRWCSLFFSHVKTFKCMREGIFFFLTTLASLLATNAYSTRISTRINSIQLQWLGRSWLPRGVLLSSKRRWRWRGWWEKCQGNCLISFYLFTMWYWRRLPFERPGNHLHTHLPLALNIDNVEARTWRSQFEKVSACTPLRRCRSQMSIPDSMQDLVTGRTIAIRCSTWRPVSHESWIPLLIKLF